MSKIQDKFLELKSKNQKALIAYLVAGYPNESGTLSAVRGLVKGGADIIELGLPFSDPLADGPVIQNASHLALKKGINFRKFISLIKKIKKKTSIPLVLMTYSNLLFKFGFDKFIKTTKEAGIDGFILPDMSVDEAKDYLIAARKYHADTIFLVSPNTEKERMKRIANSSSGFLYIVSHYGVTGQQQKTQQHIRDVILNTKKIVHKKIPIGIGFGISNPRQIRNFVKMGVDAVIIGSAFLRLIDGLPADKIENQVMSFTKSLKNATKTV
ncbi:MAG: tryptophan synthase subunit alpha [Nitrososphaerota archaeon]